MSTQAFFILDDTEATAAEALNGSEAAVDARLIDNPLANNLGLGTLQASAPNQRFVLPARILNDPLYEDWFSMFSNWPINVLDSDTIFLPFIDED
jgi:hypothetical protein